MWVGATYIILILVILLELGIIILLLKRQQQATSSHKELIEKYNTTLNQAYLWYQQQIKVLEEKYNESLEEIKRLSQYKDKYVQLLQQKEDEKKREIEKVEGSYQVRLKELQKRYEAEIKRVQAEYERMFKEEIENAKKRSRTSQRSSIKGKVAEQLAPLFSLNKLGVDPAEMRFIGTPVDYIVFKGHKNGEIEEIIFLEVKTGKSSLTKLEKQVKKAIEEKRVKWKELRIRPEEDSKPSDTNNKLQKRRFFPKVNLLKNKL